MHTAITAYHKNTLLDACAPHDILVHVGFNLPYAYRSHRRHKQQLPIRPQNTYRLRNGVHKDFTLHAH
jgi:hypothetical protein